jgi:hypothetical protein
MKDLKENEDDREYSKVEKVVLFLLKLLWSLFFIFAFLFIFNFYV